METNRLLKVPIELYNLVKNTPAGSFGANPTWNVIMIGRHEISLCTHANDSYRLVGIDKDGNYSEEDSLGVIVEETKHKILHRLTDKEYMRAGEPHETINKQVSVTSTDGEPFSYNTYVMAWEQFLNKTKLKYPNAKSTDEVTVVEFYCYHDISPRDYIDCSECY